MTGSESVHHLGDALRWALDASSDPSMASADWLAMDIDHDRPSAVRLLTDPHVSLEDLERAKHAYKTMRVVGETTADRRLGARLYAASIAAALAFHGTRISGQSDAALRRAFTALAEDPTMQQPLRDVAARAIESLGDRARPRRRTARDSDHDDRT
jgi:hypothetical protein